MNGTGPLRVLIACDHIDHGGALHGGGRQLIEVVRALDRRQVAPTVCVMRRASPLGRQLQAEGLPLRFFGDHRFSPRPLLRFLQLIRRNRIEVLHLTDFAASTWGRLAGALTRTPVLAQVISHHSRWQPRGFPRYVELAYRVLAPLTAKRIANSSSVREFAAERMGFDRDRIEVLHCALPTHSFGEPSPDEVEAVRRRHGLPPGAPVIGAVTRFHEVKGMRFLVDAFAEVCARHPDARLVLVGQGPEEPMLRARAEDVGVAHRVVFAGYRPDVAAYLAAFDVTVVPSLEEGFGLAALESLAVGVPVVASDLGGLSDVVADGVTGRLIPAEDADAIAGAALDVIEHPDRARAMGAEGRRQAQRFGLDQHVARLTAIYAELAGRVSSLGTAVLALAAI